MPERRKPAAAVATRMVVAIAERDNATWFFKISGPIEQVNLSEPIWRDFFANLKFDDDENPAWQLPAGWETGPEKSMRYATLFINDSQPPLEMSISSLGPGQDLTSNINRWRGQLSLEPIARDELELTKIESKAGKLIIFDEVGLSAGGGMGGPMMGGPMAGPPSVPSDTMPTDIKFEPPAGWTAGPSSPMVKVRLLKSDGDKQAQITVVEMPASANEWQPNVDRWAGEIGMPSLLGPEAVVRTSSIKVDGIESQQLKLIEPDEKYIKGTIAVMAKRGSSAWFFKIFGDKSIVEAGEADFEKFLQSFKFADNN